MPVKTRGTVRASKANAIFRLVFGLAFLGIGVSQYQRGGAYLHAAFVSFVIAALFVGYGIFALSFGQKIGSKLEIETPSTTERLAEISQLKANGLINESEYEAKRQEILKDL